MPINEWEYRITQFRQKTGIAFELLWWGALTGIFALLCFILCWGTLLALYVCPRTALLIISGVVLTGAISMQTGVGFYRAWCEWYDRPTPDWSERVVSVACWMWMVYCGLCCAGVRLAEDGSVLLSAVGIVIAFVGLVQAWRRATEAKPEVSDGRYLEAREVDPIPYEICELAETYWEYPNKELRTAQLLEDLHRLTTRLSTELEVSATGNDVAPNERTSNTSTGSDA